MVVLLLVYPVFVLPPVVVEPLYVYVIHKRT